MTVDWKQNAEDAGAILCDAGDLFRECYEVLNTCGQAAMAKKVRDFCERVHGCMTTSAPWTTVRPLVHGVLDDQITDSMSRF